jgi:acyl-CoA hydrolase
MSEQTEAVPLSVSHTEMTEMLLPDSTNALGRALGGVVLHWMDICGAISAMRFSNRQCVTASMDHVDFIAPIDVGEIAVIKSYAFNTGKTSIDVKVDVHSEDPRTGEKQETTTSFLTFVAIDDDGNPTQVPDVVCEDESEEQLRKAAVEKRQKELESIIERMREEY